MKVLLSDMLLELSWNTDLNLKQLEMDIGEIVSRDGRLAGATLDQLLDELVTFNEKEALKAQKKKRDV